MIQERISTFDGAEKTIKCYASWAPARISVKAQEKAKTLLKEIADAFALDNIPLFFQGIVNGDDISIIEFAPRTGGGISTQTIKKATGFDFISATIDSYLGVKPDLSSFHSLDRIFAVNQIYANNGIIGEITGWKELQRQGLIDIVSFYRAIHDSVDTSNAGSSRVFVVVVSGKDELEIKRKISKIFDSIDVFNEEGKSIIRRDLNLANIELKN